MKKFEKHEIYAIAANFSVVVAIVGALIVS